MFVLSSRPTARRYGISATRRDSWATRSIHSIPTASRSLIFSLPTIPTTNPNTALWRGDAWRTLLTTFLKCIPVWRIETVYGQMQMYVSRRSERVFCRFGFRVYGKRKVTKFERFGFGGVHIATLVRDFG